MAILITGAGGLCVQLAIAMAMAGPKLILSSMQPPAAAAIGGGGSSTRRMGQTSMRFLGTPLLTRIPAAYSRRGEMFFLTRKVH